MKTIRHLLIALTLLVTLPGCSRRPPSPVESLVDYYTCTMHPSVHAKDPGKCPICSMDLVPVLKKSDQAPASPEAMASQAESREFTVPLERQQEIGVTYATVESRSLSRTIRAVGVISPDQKRSWSFVARVDGYVQQLFVTSPGEVVEKDAPLLSIYSPDLLTAERELVSLASPNSSGKPNDTINRQTAAARLRLRQWNMTDEQITQLEKSGKPEDSLTLRSPFRGVVAKVSASQGAGVKTGEALVDVVDLSKVWAWVDFYDSEISQLQRGLSVKVSATAYPDRTFDGTIALIDPFIDPVKRTARVRIDVENADFLLRPGMYVSAQLQLTPVTALAIPVGAIMPTGLRDHVFVDKGQGRLEPRLVTLGGKYGDFYAVERGLSVGERVVSSANFLIDAEAQVQGALKSLGDKEGSHD
ncbi:N/A [soil metagenome]